MGEGTTVATVISSIGDVLTGLLGWFTDVFEFLLGNPLILAVVLIPIASGAVFGAVKLIKRFTGRRKI